MDLEYRWGEEVENDDGHQSPASSSFSVRSCLCSLILCLSLVSLYLLLLPLCLYLLLRLLLLLRFLLLRVLSAEKGKEFCVFPLRFAFSVSARFLRFAFQGLPKSPKKSISLFFLSRSSNGPGFGSNRTEPLSHDLKVYKFQNN